MFKKEDVTACVIVAVILFIFGCFMLMLYAKDPTPLALPTIAALGAAAFVFMVLGVVIGRNQGKEKHLGKYVRIFDLQDCLAYDVFMISGRVVIAEAKKHECGGLSPGNDYREFDLVSVHNSDRVRAKINEFPGHFFRKVGNELFAI